MDELKTLPNKINAYIPKWDYLVIVLFKINIVWDKVENEKIFNEKIAEIKSNIIPEKKDKVFFIRIG